MGRPLIFTYFPFPHVHDGQRHEGAVFKWPARCQSCDRQCERTSERALKLCSYGVNYYRFAENLLVAGIVVRDFPQSTPARAKMLKIVRDGPTATQVQAVRAVLDGLDAAEAAEIRDRKDAVIREYMDSAEYKQEVLELLKPHLKEMLAQIHDYRQFVAQVVQNLNVILEKRYPGIPTEEKLAKASHEEVAIYWAARLMEEKLQTVLFLVEPERLDDRSHDAAFRLHGGVLKYVRIYQRSFEQKNIRVEVSGESYADLVGNAAAVGVIPHTLLDNALKYSPRNAVVRVRFTETEATLTLAIGSYGPRIGPGEEQRIFDLFYRGEEAKRLEPDGSGFGLHLAQLVAAKYGTSIRVTQDGRNVRDGRVWTEFSVSFNRRR